MEETSILDSIRYAHFFTELATAYILVYIWYKYNTYYRKVIKFEDEVDYGLLFLATGVFFWGVISLMKASPFEANNFPVYETFSTINNALILSSFPFFVHGFKALKEKRYRVYWFVAIAFTTIAILIIFVILHNYYSYSNENKNIYQWFSFPLSLITSIGLMILFYNTFESRKLSGMMFFSVIIIMLLIFPQFDIFWDAVNKVGIIGKDYEDIIFMTSSVGLSFILISLSMSWMTELSQNIHINVFSIENDQYQKEILNENIDKEELYKRFEDLIKDDKLEELSEELTSFLRNINQSILYYSSVSFIGELSRLNLQKIRGEILDNDYILQRNKIRGRMIDAIELLKKKLKRS